MEASRQDNSDPQSNSSPQNNSTSLQDLDFFVFLKADDEKLSRSPSFFSENGLSQDIIQVTGAEPDICLEVFYALYHTLWPQIEKLSDVSFKGAWIRFIGSPTFKGVLCPPEKLITEKRVSDIKRSLSKGGEIFKDIYGVVNSISYLKQKIIDYPGQLSYKDEIISSLKLIEDFYLRFRNQVKALIQDILEKEEMNASSVPLYDALEKLLEPKATMTSEIFSKHWAYRISRSKAHKLLSLDADGRSLENNHNDPSNHQTTKPFVFFKANGKHPNQPEKEFMLYSLYRNLQIPVPETALLILTDVFEANPGDFYTVQASEAVLGESSSKACQDPESIFDHEAYVSQVIGAFLTNPSNGSFKNLMYSSKYQTLVPIDNDEIFKPDFDERIVNVKSLLFLLPQIDLPISKSTKIFWTTLDPHLTILSWLQDLSQKNMEYNILFSRLAFQKAHYIYPSEVPCLEDFFCPKILVSPNLLQTVTRKLQVIEKTLLNNQSVSLQVLFEEISPVLAKYYRKLRFEFDDIEEAEGVLWGNKNNYELSSLLDHEEFGSLSKFEENLTAPKMFFKEYKDLLISNGNPLDSFIKRHSERKNKNALNLQAALKELQLLIQEGLTTSHSITDIVDFIHSLSKVIENNPHLTKGITCLLSSLPHPELHWLLTVEKYFLRIDSPFPKDLIPFSLIVDGAFMKQRRFALTELESQYLFDQQGNLRKNSSITGRSNVTYFPEENPEFYLKQYPEWPGYEFASILFMRLLGIPHLPYQDLIILDSKYPVLLSQKVSGSPIFRIWHNSKAFINLDPFHTALLIISAMLLNPEDGKEDNYILSQDGKYLIPIDSDHCFLPSFFQKEGTFWNFFTINTALQTKTLLFCLDLMCMPIPREVRQQILSIDFDELLPSWMAELDKIESKFNNLVDQKQRNQFLKQGTIMRIPFYKQFIHNLYWKAHKIQNILKTTLQSTPFDLLNLLHGVKIFSMLGTS